VGDTLKRVTFSFKDVCFGVNRGDLNSSSFMKEDTMLENDIEKDFVEYKELEGAFNNPLCPTIRVTKDVVHRASQPWKNC